MKWILPILALLASACSYYFSPEVLVEIAAAVGARARTQGYRM